MKGPIAMIQAFSDDAKSKGQHADGVGGRPAAFADVSQYQFSVTGNNSAATIDQVPFFNRNADVALGASFVVATPVPGETPYTASQVADYVALSPLPLININITGASSATSLAGMKIQVVRTQPDGLQAARTFWVQAYQTAQDFQNTRVQIPIGGEVLDGFTFIRSLSTSTTPAATFQIVFSFGGRMDRRAEVPSAQAAVIKSPGA